MGENNRGVFVVNALNKQTNKNKQKPKRHGSQVMGHWSQVPRT